MGLKKKYYKETKRKYYLANEDKIRKAQKTRYEADKEKWKFEGRKRRLKKLYWPDLTPDEAYEEYLKMVEKQNNLCAICGKSETKIDPQLGKPCVLAIDHDHISGKVRALLCFRCNTNLGWVEANGSAYEAYLNRFKKAE